MRYNQELSHPDDIGFNLRHVIRATSGSFVCHPDDIVHWPKSHPDEVLPRAKSSGRLREQLSFICHPDDLLHRQWVYRLRHAYSIGTRALPRSPHYGPFVRESNPNAAIWDWYCFVVRLNNLLINQSNHQWVQKLRHSCDVTGMSQRDIEQLTLCSKIRNKQHGWLIT